MPRVRGGTGLVAELLAQQGAWASPFVHVGYGLRRYELAAACFDPRKPSLRGTEKPKPLADSTVLRAFNMFDKVRCPVRTGCAPLPRVRGCRILPLSRDLPLPCAQPCAHCPPLHS